MCVHKETLTKGKRTLRFTFPLSMFIEQKTKMNLIE